MPKKTNGQAKASIPAPTANAPKTPKGFNAPAGRIAGANATSQQERDALDVAREVTASKSYVADFTARAPTASDFAAQLTTAKAWSDELAAAEAWAKYARVQRDLAWKEALATAKQLKIEFDVAVNHDAAVAARYPQTQAFFGVWKAVAARAAATKASKKKAVAKGAPKGDGK